MQTNQLSYLPWYTDLRSLGLFRIMLGLALLWQVSWRVADFDFWYTSSGFLTTSLQNALMESHTISPLQFFEPYSAAICIALLFILTIPFLLGKGTRIITPLLAFLFWCLMNYRYYLQGNEMDVTFWCLVWASFLPINKAFSLSSQSLEKLPLSERNYHYSSAAVLGLAIQISFLYWMNSIYKNDPKWDDGTILAHFLSLGMYTRPFGEWLLNLPGAFLSALAIGILYFERLAPLLLLAPYAPARLFTVLALMLMHIGFGTAMSVGLYPYMCLVWLAALLPPLFWEKLLSYKPIARSPLTASQTLNISAVVVTVFVVASNFIGYLGLPGRDLLRRASILQTWGNFTKSTIIVGHPLFLVEENGKTVDLYRRYISLLPETEILVSQPANGPIQYGNYGILNSFDWRRDIHRKYIENAVAASSDARTAAFRQVALNLCARENIKDGAALYVRAMYYHYDKRKAETYWEGSCEPPSQP